MKTLIVAAVPEELYGLPANFDVLYTGIGKKNAEEALRAYLNDLTDAERRGLTVFNAGTAGSFKYKRGTLLYPTVIRGYQNGVIRNTMPVAWQADRYIDSYPGVCFSSDDFITEDNISTLDTILYDCVDMEAFTEAIICREMGVRFISLKLVSDSFNVSLEQWRESLSEVVHKLVDAIETLKKNNIIA